MKPVREEIKRTTEYFHNPERAEARIDVPRTGARRKYVKVHPSFYPVLTHRQLVERNGYVKLSHSMGRLYTMSRDKHQAMNMADFVANLSNEELARGQIKDKNGRFTGTPPAWVPREFHRACVSELMRRGKRLWQENYLEAIQAMTDIAVGRGAGQKATPGERLKAAQYVVERLEGKVPERLVVTDDKKWAMVIDGIVAEVDDTAIERGRKALNAAEAVVVEGSVEEEEDFDEAYDYELESEPEPVRKPTPRRRSAARTRRS